MPGKKIIQAGEKEKESRNELKCMSTAHLLYFYQAVIKS